MTTNHQLVAIMFSDIVGYTAMMGTDSNKALQLVRQSKHIQQTLVEKHEGKWLKEMGDGAMVQFNSALNAVNCAIDIQKSARNELDAKLRIGIHIGDITIENNDIYGDGVNVASRLESIADPGGIYISESIEKAIRGQSKIATIYLGESHLKNVDYGVRTYAIQGDGLPKPKIGLSLRLKRNLSIAVILMLALIMYWVIIEDRQAGNKNIKAVAVMPFDNLSADPDQDYFADGMTFTLVANLGKVSALKVIMNKSTIQLKQSKMSFAEIGSELKVDAIIEGAVIREGDNVRITARMIDAFTEELLWAESYDYNITSILKLHSEVAQAIVEEISILVTPEEFKELREAEEVDPIAYESLLKGLYHLYKLNPNHYDIALEYFQATLEKDPANAQAYAAIALVWLHKGQWGGVEANIAAKTAKNAANHALELNETLPMAHMALANIYTGYDWDWDKAVEEWEKTISLNPNLSESRLFYADLLVSLHQNEEAHTQINIALELDPLNAFSYCLKGWVLMATGQQNEAIAAINTSLASEPNIPLSHRCLWTIYHLRGDYDLALEHAILFYRAQDLNDAADDLEESYHQLGYIEALKYSADQLAARTANQYVSAMRVARLYTFSGDKDQALNWLEKAYQEHYISFFSLNVDPHWQSLHDEPRFLDLVEKMNLSLEAK